MDGHRAVFQRCPARRAYGDDLAYVIYTSVRTGKPKASRFRIAPWSICWLSMSKKPGVKANDTLLAVTTLSFDIAGLELFLAARGGCETCDRQPRSRC